MIIINKTSIKDSKILVQGLIDIYGINRHNSLNICYSLNYNPKMKINKLKNTDLAFISKYIDKNYIINVEKKKQLYWFDKKYLDLNNVRGLKKKLK